MGMVLDEKHALLSTGTELIVSRQLHLVLEAHVSLIMRIEKTDDIAWLVHPCQRRIYIPEAARGMMLQCYSDSEYGEQPGG